MINSALEIINKGILGIFFYQKKDWLKRAGIVIFGWSGKPVKEKQNSITRKTGKPRPKPPRLN